MSIPLNTKEVVPWVCVNCSALAIHLPPTWIDLNRHKNPRACLCKRCKRWLDE